jgi:CubicO group peptidase (beta-lactamase class C family)
MGDSKFNHWHNALRWTHTETSTLPGEEVTTIHTCRRLRYFFVVAFFLCAVSCGSTTGRADYWPTDGWRSSPPEEQGLDPKALSEIDYYVKETFPAVKGVLVVRNGYVVFENYYQGYDRSDYHHVFSVTKSVTSALVGIALKEDHIEDLDQHLPEFFPEHFGPGTDPRKRQITVENLLTMANGFRLNTDASDNKSLELIMSSDDVVEASIEQPMAKEPGEEFNYNDGGAHLISAILTKTTGQSALAYAHQNLFGPLGIDSDPDASIQFDPANVPRFEQAGFMWSDDGRGNSIGAFGLKLTARDMAKLGYLYLQEGRWEGKQIVPRSYVQASTREQVETGYGGNGAAGYGYLWWMREVDGYRAFYASGYGGQYIYVIPELNLVAVIVSEAPGRGEIAPGSPDRLLDYAVVPAVEDE